jgi:MFS family permease
MNTRYVTLRRLWKYLGGASAARAGDEMSSPALLLLGLAVTGRPATGSELLASVTIAGAAGGPFFGALLDRARRPERVLAATLAAYAVGIGAIAAAAGALPMPLVVVIALAAGLFNPAVAGGWTSQLPRIVTGPDLAPGSALDAMTFSAASLAGPGMAALIAAGFGARLAVIVAAALVGLAVPAACSLRRYPPSGTPGPAQATRRQAPAHPQAPVHREMAVHRQMAAGFAAIVARRPLLRATVTSVVSYAGIGMLIVCCPVLGAQRLGGAARGALLISAIAVASLAANAILARRGPRGEPDTRVLVSTLIIGASMAAAALAPGWLTVLAVAVAGAGEGPQLTALFAVRHRESPGHMRGQVFTTAASLKIGGMAAGAALAGTLAGRSVTGCLLVAAGIELCAAAAYLLTGRSGRRSADLYPAGDHAAALPRPAEKVAGADTPVRSGKGL